MNAFARIDAELIERLWHQSGQCFELAHVLLATDEMLKAAQNGNWDRVSELESSRRNRLGRCLAKPVLAANSQIFSEALAIMLHMNEELVALLEAAKANAVVRHKGDRGAHEAIGHYLDAKTGYL